MAAIPVPLPSRTGGTPAPVQRARAGAQALGAPRYYNKASGKMETAQALRAFRPTRSSQPPARVAPTRQVSHTSAPAAKATSVFNLQSASPAEIQKYATSQVTGENKANLLPYEKQASTIQGTEQTVAKRYGGYGEATDKLLGNLQTGAQASAKTFENQAAESALKAQSEVGTPSPTMDPQLKAQIEAEKGNVAGIGAAAGATANALGANETNYLTNLRGAAAQRVVEGQTGIASDFNKQRTANQAREEAVLAKSPGQITRLTEGLLQKQFTDRSAEQALGVKVGQLGVAQQNAASKAQGVVNTRQSAVERTRATERGQNITAQKNLTDAQYKQASLGEKERYDSSRIKEGGEKIRLAVEKAHSPTGGKPLPPAQISKGSGELAAAYQTIAHMKGQHATPEQIRNALTTGTVRSQAEGEAKAHNTKTAKVTNPVIVKAAEQIYTYHYLNPQTKAELEKVIGPTPAGGWSNLLIRK